MDIVEVIQSSRQVPLARGGVTRPPWDLPVSIARGHIWLVMVNAPKRLEDTELTDSSGSSLQTLYTDGT